MQDPAEHLADLRRRPALYLGSVSLSALRQFLNGYAVATECYSDSAEKDPLLIPLDFSGWVAYRLGLPQSALGWCAMLLDRSESETDAFEQFFNLLDEYRKRTPHMVAKLEGYQKTYQRCVQRKVDGEYMKGVLETRAYPESISLVTYTSDRGFFAYSDSEDKFPCEGFFNSIESFEAATGASRDMLRIVDHEWNFGT